MTVHLLNGSTEQRVRSSEGCALLPCGCAHTTGELQRWLQACDAHHTEWQERHAYALAQNTTGAD